MLGLSSNVCRLFYTLNTLLHAEPVGQAALLHAKFGGLNTFLTAKYIGQTAPLVFSISVGSGKLQSH